MVVNHLQKHSNKEMSLGRGKSQKSDKKSGHFEDMLSQSLRSQKKKSSAKKASQKKPVTKRKEAEVGDIDSQQQRLKKPQAKKTASPRTAKRPVAPVQNQAQRGVKTPHNNNEKVSSLPGSDAKTVNENALKMDMENKRVEKNVALFENSPSLKAEGQKKTQGVALSKDSSETLEKTLTAHEKKLVQDLQAKQLKREANIFQPNTQAKKVQGLNAFKNNSLKMNTSVESSSSQGSEAVEALEGLKSKLSQLSKDHKGLSQDNGKGLDNSFTPSADADIQVDQMDKSFFAEKLAEVDGNSTRADKIENMDSIIKQARTFIKDGGGEMQIELAPEGLGKIQLKVAVENGKAQVEMFADNKLAKSALEESLGEMKLGLENQRLIVDHLKVEMSQDYERDFSQLKDNLMEQEQREFARQFLNQFRDEKNERWDGMFSGFKNYARTGAKPELSLQPSVGQQAIMAKNKGRSLNVVA